MQKNTQKASVGEAMIRDMNDLINTLKAGGMEAVQKKFRVTTYTPEQWAELKAKFRIRTLREKLNATQPDFARLLGVLLPTLKAWEKGAKKPSAIAERFLAEIELNPKYWRKRLKTLHADVTSPAAERPSASATPFAVAGA